jgi:hypothetical protein
MCLLFSCGKKTDKKDPVEPAPDLLQPILERRDVYLSLQKTALNEFGYAHAKCDSLGFTSLCKAAGGCPDADIFLSEDNGRWYRSPEKDCFDKGESKSDFSKDMALMLFIYIYELSKTDNQNAKEALQRFSDYVKGNNYVMGRPTDNAEGISRVLMSPGLIASMERLSAKLNGQPYQEQQKRDVILPIINKGFQAHLDVLGIWLDGELRGNITETEKRVLEKQVERQPRNAIFRAVYSLYGNGDQSETLRLLSDEKIFPADRLPESRDRCEEYVFQRDDSDDWLPCDKGEIHDAVDFLVAGYMAEIWK